MEESLTTKNFQNSEQHLAGRLARLAAHSAKGTFYFPARHEMPGSMATLKPSAKGTAHFHKRHEQFAVPLALSFSVETEPGISCRAG